MSELVELNDSIEDFKMDFKALIEELREMNKILRFLHEDMVELKEIMRWMIRVEMQGVR